MGEDDLVLVGEIASPFGVQGEVKMRPWIARPEALATLPAVQIVRPDGRTERRRVRHLRWHQGIALLALDGVDRATAETLRGAQIKIAKAECPPLDADEWYEWELVGLRVITESGRDLGTVERVYYYPANDVYETAVALIPAIESVIVAVDRDAKTMTVRDIPGLRKDE